ncbi:adaptin N terminal region-domain-containing protein [Armillaria luteobubalina]|uniref:Adaptin N terminal region-domain-containing protein n=1 Tax=Armillaria luteobubalina TaxID=153913 RepID=A0AA39Q2W0_9AGAR|nr:adaptin N terminal region-domain-containing protein [Armillaria luteobubalina]
MPYALYTRPFLVLNSPPALIYIYYTMPERPPNWLIGTAAGVALTPVLAPAALGIVGFSAAGPVAGTLAAAIQSGIGNVAAGSAFAFSGAVGWAAGWAAGWFGGDGPGDGSNDGPEDGPDGEPDPTLICKQLDSGSDKEKLDAMEWLVALIFKGHDVSEYFSHVIKNVTSQIFEIRKLVYIYLVKYAEQEPVLSLPFIKTFQRDLNGSDPFIRAKALRVLRELSGKRGGRRGRRE